MATNIPITTKCNQNCVYCAAVGRDEPNFKYISGAIAKENKLIGITGGEPTMSPALFKLIHLAKCSCEKVELQTNGTVLSYEEVAQRLIDAEVDQFNIALPSHLPELDSKITQTEGMYDKRIKGIRNLLDRGAKVRITEIINSLNYMHLEDYAEFIKEKFPEIYLLEFNFIKGEGRAKGREDLIPKQDLVIPHLLAALDLLKDSHIDILVDHLPLCNLEGHEHLHPDISKILFDENKDFFFEKEHIVGCDGCSLKKICNGPRKDYVEIHGDDVRASKKDPAKIISKVEQMNLQNQLSKMNEQNDESIIKSQEVQDEL